MTIPTLVKLIAKIFQPSGEVIYDILIPAVIMSVGSATLYAYGLTDRETAVLCFLVGGVCHVLLQQCAGYLMQRKANGDESAGRGRNEW